ncbi:energy transducer TonB [Candidatus Aalborgicola defluviihabitans]|uniref:energy transducer TonB n=1 Tax=Candidatus Aalborgicola defluviihabitans TaxID=3386187 RepID=UPI001D8C436C|nr:TonB family protein [Burkholderiales bacterium]MBK7312512.1 TonB family protein [Burkholderiales bacterium]MBL0243320.1 TonB family protein [Rhodoferax sp.]
MRSFSTIQIALFASAAVHAVLLTVRFVDPEAFNRVFEDTPLEVILVNARTDEKPVKAQAIAQHSLAGGGDAEKGRATSPLPPSALTDFGDATEEEAARKLQTLQEQQTLLLTQVKNQLAALPPPDPNRVASKAEQQEREEKRRQLIKILAEIERRINEQNAKPKKRYISPAAREAVYAVYYDALRHAIEDKGTENFPQAGGKKLYGELTMIVTVNHNGRVLDTEVVESSGNRTLDRHAAAIAKSAGPFGNFSPAMRRQADQILVVSRFKFTRDETLEAAVSTHP